jgi:transposase-like protein
MEQDGNQNRRHYSPEQKVKILREHLENRVPLSDLAEKYGIHVNDLYNWMKKLFEEAAEIFSGKQNGKVSLEEKENERLKEKLKSKDRLISELVEENIGLKKNLTGEI